MVHVAQSILKEQGIDMQLITPLLKETIHKLDKLKAMEAQTGPAVRNDRETMEKHLELLRDHPEWQKMYTFMSQMIRSTVSE